MLRIFLLAILFGILLHRVWCDLVFPLLFYIVFQRRTSRSLENLKRILEEEDKVSDEEADA